MSSAGILTGSISRRRASSTHTPSTKRSRNGFPSEPFLGPSRHWKRPRCSKSPTAAITSKRGNGSAIYIEPKTQVAKMASCKWPKWPNTYLRHDDDQRINGRAVDRYELDHGELNGAGAVVRV